METVTAITRRRAVKAFDPNHRLSESEVEQLLTLATFSPTAFNIQNWRFVVVRDPHLRRQIREVSWDQPQVTDASLFIVLCADLKAWAKHPERYWRDVPEDLRNFIVPAIDGYYRGKEQVQRDEAMRSCGMAAQTLMLAAQSMGYDSCPMDGFDFAAVGRLINLPADHVVAMFVAIGKGADAPWPRGGKLPLAEVVINDRF